MASSNMDNNRTVSVFCRSAWVFCARDSNSLILNIKEIDDRLGIRHQAFIGGDAQPDFTVITDDADAQTDIPGFGYPCHDGINRRASQIELMIMHYRQKQQCYASSVLIISNNPLSIFLVQLCLCLFYKGQFYFIPLR